MSKEEQLERIDNQMKQLERVDIAFQKTQGYQNEGIAKLIQELTDERNAIVNEK